MASLSSRPSAVARSSRATTNAVSSLRVKPFLGRNGSAALKQQPPVFRLRAAEAEAAAEATEAEAPVAEETFEFNFADAKKGNEYQDSDIEAALRYYYEGAAAPSANEDFVANMFGGEDASFFDDIDNEDDGDWDEYAVAGIPEAAPKRGQGAGKGEEGAADGEEDGAAQGKALAVLQAMEDQMVLDADMEETFGQAGDAAEARSEGGSAANAVWSWLGGDAANAPQDVDEAVPSGRHSSVALPSDDEVFSAFSALKVDELDEQTRDMLELIIGDDPSDADLTLADEASVVEGEVPESVAFTQQELENIDALAEHQLGDLAQFEELMPEESEQKFADDEDAGVVVSQKSFDAYIASLQQAASSDSDLSMTYEQITEMFSAANVSVREDNDTTPALELGNILGSEPELPAEAALGMDLNLGTTDVGDSEIQGVKEELLALAGVETFGEDDLPNEQQIEVLEQYLSAVEQLDGQDDDTEVVDLEAEYAEHVAADVAGSEGRTVDVVNYDLDNEDDGETWLERVIELTRVTKVTKGGKVIGFRCTAVVGNGKGLVGVGCQSGVEIGIATKRALVDAKRNVVRVPLVAAGTIPHKSEAKYHAARCVLVPASDGTGVIAGGSIKAVLELAGVQNVLAKRLGCRSLLNNARCTIKALQQLRTLYDVSKARGVPMDQLLLSQDA